MTVYRSNLSHYELDLSHYGLIMTMYGNNDTHLLARLFIRFYFAGLSVLHKHQNGFSWF